MRQLRIALRTTLVLLISLAFPPAVLASDGDSPGILRSGIAAVARMSDDPTANGGTAFAQQDKLNADRKTTIIAIAVAATATVVTIIWIRYQVGHSGITLTF